MLILNSCCLLVFLCLVSSVTAGKHRHKLEHKHKHAVKRQTPNSYGDSSSMPGDISYPDHSSSSDAQQSSSSNEQEQTGYNNEQAYLQDTNNEQSSSYATGGETSDQSSRHSSADTEQIDESQPAWCQDNLMCSNYNRSDCEDAEWVQINCPRKCNFCLEKPETSTSASTTSTASNATTLEDANTINQNAPQLPNEGENWNQSIYFTSVTSPPPDTNNPATTEVESSKTSSFSDNKLHYNYTMEVQDLPQTKIQTNSQTNEMKTRKRPLLEEEDINITLPNAMKNDESSKSSPVKQASSEPKGYWCTDEEKCSKMKKSECKNDWMQLNCPKTCGICEASFNTSSTPPVKQDYHEVTAASIEKKKNHKEYVEDIRVTLPSEMLSPREKICDDHIECIEYPVSSCNQEWMKENCRKKCALCKGKSKNIPETKTEEYTLAKAGDNTAVCYYDGVPHDHGSKWSPGPCTPECDCQNGNVRCTVIQCPKITCDRQVKKRWSCCPKCSDQDDVCVKATEENSKNSSCCVLPFIFRGVQYETCTDEKHNQPWCSLTENFDVDGKWGICVEPKPVSTTVEHFSNTKLAVPVEKEPQTTKEKPRPHVHRVNFKKHEKKLRKPDKEHFHKENEGKQQTETLGNSLNAKPEHVEEDEEEILRKYGSKQSHEEQDVEPEPLDGGYTEWSPWTKCKASCGGGTQEKFRKCTRPIPIFGGLDCRHIGPAIESRECNTAPCLVNGGFSSWNQWVECSTSCGGGVTTRSRVCDNPTPKYGGRDCVVRGQGQAVEIKDCNSIPCEGQNAYSPWSEWGKCNKKCAGGVMTRRRTCTSSRAGGNGHDCSLLGAETETKSCNTDICAVDGGYTSWTAWSPCSRSCGPGITSRHRTCTQPSPSETGKDCSVLGQAFEQQACYIKDCKESDNWKKWSAWGKCTTPCGGGLQYRSRKCIGKQTCAGKDRQSQLCNAQHCPIHGNYTEWSAWRKCSMDCGEGKATRTRICTNPAPRFGGETCIQQGLGQVEDTQKCNIRDCQVSRDGGYGSWSDWTKCSMTCGAGARSRYRTCDHPRQQGIGKDCTRLGVGIQTVPCFNQECPIHGNYTDWSDWSLCSSSCGEGSRFRTRSCTNPEPEAGGNSCQDLGEDIESESCIEAPCPVEAQLGKWSAWNGCSKSCGYGIRRRTRRCIGSSQYGESYCDQTGVGQTQEAEKCFDRSCPVDGNFGSWSAWSLCSTSCGGGAMSRFRNCSEPVPVHGGRGCERIGASFDVKSCGENFCPVDGGYSTWSEYGPCSRSCGSGEQKRTRSCSSPSPEHGGKDCSQLGSNDEMRECATEPCPINGNYSAWSAWSNCSSPCGNGVMVRSRSCINPAPSFGGQDCTSIGPKSEQQNCIVQSCPEICSCGGWTAWSECGQTCGGGYQTRKRQCTPPKSGVESCANEEQETQLCNLNICPVDGAYSPWSDWSACSEECGTGHKSRSRECNNPVPAFGGRPCQEVNLGEPYETQSCVQKPCPTHGKYSSWSAWGACSSTCGMGQKKRTRACDNPTPAYGGLDCSRYGLRDEAVDCFVADCPTSGGYSPWSEWSECSKSCGWGSQSRDRDCNSPEPSHGGLDCTVFGESNDVQPCMMVECPVDGQFTEWSAWGECSKTCAEGRKRRKRYCSSPKPDFGGKTCNEQKLGVTAEISKCDLGPCPEHGDWDEWSAWSYCSASCGRGNMKRSRECDSPKPIGGGKPCVGLVTQQKDCSVRDCPINGNYTNWGAWTECDSKCGLGFQTRWKSCSNPVATAGGQDCAIIGPDVESRTCHRKPCNIDGSWGQWSRWSGCSKTCGDGVQVRTRLCEDPNPQAGGLRCNGPSNEEKYCRQRDCCDIPFVDLGCFVDTGNPSTLPEVLMTDTDINSPLFSGVSVKRGLKDWDDYVNDLICRCAQITNEKGYTHFGIQNLGECRSGVGVDRNYASQGARVAFTHHGPKPWVGCIGKGSRQCKRPSLNCVGQDQTNYVYGLKNISPINGNYTAWSLWSPCSKSCDRGTTSRRRRCTNPPALYGGKDCVDIGSDEEVQECMLKTCPVNGAWSGWTAWNQCSASCSTGKRTRIRGCNSPTPSHGGDLCSGPDTEIAECYLHDCPADGRWSDWQAWEPCSVSCGFGVQVRTRYCNNPAPINNGEMCEGDLVESIHCEAKPCPIHGSYADWSNWAGCSRSCGRGSKTRVRKCISPVPRYGGESCKRLGPAEEKVHCNAFTCPVHGNWGVWNSWSTCSAACGPGVRTRERRCNNPYPNYGGESCAEHGHESTVCSMPDCAIDGNWGAWTAWSNCQSDCGVATRQRTRACIDPPPAHGGKGCEGTAGEYHDCKLDHCPVSGAYSDWSDWSNCDQSCGTGHKLRMRSCSNPEPKFRGMNCSTLGPDEELVACNTDPCPVNGGWSGWTSWSSCSQTCSMGVTTRSRACSYPVAEFGGKPCTGKGEEKKVCKDFDCCDVPHKDIGCYIDTQRSPRPLPELIFSDRDKISWKKWKSFMSDLICRCAKETRNKQYTHFGIQHYGECYSGPESWKTFKDEGVRQDFTRPPDAQPWVGCVDESLNDCKEPNLSCVGKQNTNFVYTVDDVKPVDGNYSDWTEWSACSSSCGPGSRYRIRSCTNPPPSFSGQPCYNIGSDEEIEECFHDSCPTHGQWGNWRDWTKCSGSCGGGRTVRTRPCDNPKPDHGGDSCHGPGEESVECNLHRCPIRGMWSNWAAWSQCSSSCGNGQQSRKRECNDPKAEFDGKPCVGPGIVFQNCVEKECPGIWGDWSDWSECSRTCGSGGTHARSRSCQGGQLCKGAKHETKQCKLQQCPECTTSADIAFILDGSGATDESLWNKMKTFARGIANAFLLHDDATRVGLITYSTQPKLELQFDEKNDRDEFSDFLNTVSTTHGSSDLERALAMANEKLFTPEAGMRTKVPNVVLVLTEEGPTMLFNGYNDSARSLKEKGVTLIGVGVGDKINQLELQRVATSPEHAFMADSLEDAIASISAIANTTCLAKPTPPQVKWGSWSDWSSCSRLCDAGLRHRTRSCLNGDECVGGKTEESQCVLQKCPECKSILDIVFAIPIADSIPKEQLNDAKKFVRGVIDGLSVSPQRTHVGLLGYFDYPRVELKLDTFYDKEDILRALSAVSTVDGFNNTRIDSALRATQADMFSQANGVRAYVPKVLVFLASGDASNQNLKTASMPLKLAGTTIIPLVVGNLETKAVAPMGTSTRHYFASDTFDNLASKLDDISKKLCAAPLYATSFSKPVKPHSVSGISKLFLKSTESSHVVIKPDISSKIADTVFKVPAVHQIKNPTSYALAKALNTPVSNPSIQKNPIENQHVGNTGAWKDWGTWSECSKSCGTGTSTRRRQCGAGKCVGRAPAQASPCKLQDCPACHHNLDLVLAVDSSDAVSKNGWKKIKSFMTGILDAFEISEAETHVGILTFSSVPYLETRLSENFKKDDIVLLVNNMQQLQGKQRRIDKALRMAVAEFFSPKSRGFRDDTSKALVLITGGNPTAGSESLTSAVKPLQQNGVSAVAVGIGSDIDEAQLRSVGRKTGNALKVPNYEDLLSYVSSVVKDVCEGGHTKPPPLPPPVPKPSSSKLNPPPPPPPPAAGGDEKKLSWPTKEIESLINKWGTWSNWASCSQTCGEGRRARSRECAGYNCTGPALNKEACFLQDCPDCQKGIDLVFAVDGSDDVVDKEFMQEKSFLMNVLNAFKISKDLTRVAVATYGSEVAQDIPLTNQFDKDSLFVAVNSLIRSKGRSNLEKVLETARTKLFTGSRDNVAKVLVVLTSDKSKRSEAQLAEHSQALKKSGINVVAVGVGSSDKSARDMLSKVATSSTRVFPITSFNELVNNVYLVATSACQATPALLTADERKTAPAKPSMCATPMDVAFALDSSEDVNSFQWQQQKDFVKQVIDGLRIAPDGVHTGIVSYAAIPSIGLKLNVRNKDKQQLFETVQGLGRAVGRRNIAGVLDMSKYEVFTPKAGRRSETPSTLVLLQFGANRPASDDQNLKETAKSLQKAGVRVYAVGVGSKTSREDMASFASSLSDIMHLPSLNNHDMANKLIKALCEGQRKKESSAVLIQDRMQNKKVNVSPKKLISPNLVTQTVVKQNSAIKQTSAKIPVNAVVNPATPSIVVVKSATPLKTVKKLNSDTNEHVSSPSTQNDKKLSSVSPEPVSPTAPIEKSTKTVDVVASSCRELKRRTRGAEDGEFPIMFSPHCAPVKLYCHGMNTDDPAEYLTLPQGSDANYASFHKERLKNFHNCDGPTYPSPPITANVWGTTRFSKIGINPKNGLVKQDDFRFAISEGNPVKFGRGGDCFSSGQCRRGGFKIDLSGTGLKLRDDVKWNSWGAPKVGSRMINFTKSPDATKISAVCGGSCGGCQPKTGRIYLTPSSCDTPVEKRLKRSFIEAMEVVDAPEKDENVRKTSVTPKSRNVQARSHNRRQRNHQAKKILKHHHKKILKNIAKKHSFKTKRHPHRKSSRKH